jgi:NAD(P)H-nitrite reductase large subunit
MLAKSCGIECGRAVLVNEYLETSKPNIFAAGDCMEWNGISHGIIPVALETAKVAAQNMIKKESASYEGTVPSNTLQVAGIDLTSIGTFSPASQEYESIVSADEDEGTYFKVVVHNDIAVGGISLGSRKFALKLRGLIRNKDSISSIRNTIFDF